MIAFAHAPSMGVAAATLVQAAFYSSLIIVAVLIVASRCLRTQVEIA
jgi:hypothetical protein